MKDFTFEPSKWVPFKDKKVVEKIRSIKKEDITKHPNPDLKIRIVRDEDFDFLNVIDIFSRIKNASDKGNQLVLIVPQQDPLLAKVAYLINKFRVNCKKLYTFNMDEWADENGNIAPETYPYGFLHAMKHNFYYKIDEELRPPEKQITGPTNENFKYYGKMIEDLGGADVCYGGIGWSSHIAFVDPDTEEFAGTLEEFKHMGPRIVTLNPFTIAQSSIAPDAGKSGDWSSIAPRAATIGPKEVLGAKLRSSWNPFIIGGSSISWQRFTVRLALFGPVTPKIPASILQLARSEIYLTETIAQDIENDRTWLVNDFFSE